MCITRSSRNNPLPARFKWLDYGRLCSQLAPGATSIKATRFTAPVLNNVSDPDQRARQAIYWRALQAYSSPTVDIVEGRFIETRKSGIVVTPLNSGATVGSFVRIETREEKGTDVAIGVAMVADALTDRVDHLVLLSNDTDLCGAIDIVRRQGGKDVVVYNPSERYSSRMAQSTTKYRRLSRGLVQACELPATITDGRSVIVRPNEWDR